MKAAGQTFVTTMSPNSVFVANSTFSGLWQQIFCADNPFGNAYFIGPMQQQLFGTSTVAVAVPAVFKDSPFSSHDAKNYTAVAEYVDLAHAIRFQDMHATDPFLLSSVLMFGALQGRAKQALRFLGRKLRDKLVERTLDLLLRRPEYVDTTAYQVAVRLQPLFKIHRKIADAGCSWYTDLLHNDRFYVLSRIAAGNTDLSVKGINVTTYPKLIRLKISGKGNKPVIIELMALSADPNMRTEQVFERLNVLLSKQGWHSAWYRRLSRDERRDLCSYIVKNAGTLDVNDDDVESVSVEHRNPILRIEHKGSDVLEFDSFRDISFWSVKSLMQRYTRELRQIVKSHQAASKDDEDLAMCVLASLVAREISDPRLQGSVEFPSLYDKDVTNAILQDKGFRAIVSESIIARVLEDVKKARQSRS